MKITQTFGQVLTKRLLFLCVNRRFFLHSSAWKRIFGQDLTKYALFSSQVFMIFDNRVEIVSPGHLPDGMSVEEIRYGNTFQRNPLIAAFCAKTMHYRGLGTGILRAIKEGADMEFVNNESGDSFTVIIHRPSNEVKVQEIPVLADKEVFNIIREKCPNLPMEETERAVRLLSFCRAPKGLLEMMEAVHYTSRTSFRRRLLNHLLEAKLLLPEVPDKPNSPRQRYLSVLK